MLVKFVNPTTSKLNTKFLAASDLIEKSTLANASTITTTVIPKQLEESGGKTSFRFSFKNVFDEATTLSWCDLFRASGKDSLSTLVVFLAIQQRSQLLMQKLC